MHRNRPILFLLFFALFCASPVLAETPVTEQDAETQKLVSRFVETLPPVFEMHFTGDYAPLKAGEAYALVSEDQEKRVYRFEANELLDGTGRKVACLITPEKVEISMAVTDKGAFRQAAIKASENVGIFHRYERTEHGEKVTFRAASYELPDLYYEAVLTSREEGETTHITLGFHRRIRSRTTAVFENPDARWELLDATPVKEIYNPRARIQMSLNAEHKEDIFGTHTLELRFPGPAPWLVFTPGLYPMWVKKNEKGEQEKFFLDTLTGIYIDNQCMDAYVRDDVPFSKNDKQFAMQLDEASLEHLKNGKEIRFELLTTHREKTHIIFPLRRSQAVIAKAVELYDRNGVTRLMAAVLNQDYEGVRKELEGGAAVNAKTITGMPALAFAVRQKDPKMIRLLGTSGYLDTEWKNREGDGYLHTAAHYYRGTDVLEALLAIGCDPDIPDSEGRTPLSRSVCYEGLGKLKTLLKAGADINKKDNNGNTVLHHTARNNFTSKEEMGWYLDHGADIDARNNEGETPLMVALANQTWGDIKVFLDHDMDLTLKNKAGKSALDIAREYRDCPDLTEKIPLLGLHGEEVVKQTRESYKNLATLLEGKTRYTIGFTNKTDETVQVALRFLDLDGEWETAAWYRISPGDQKLLKQTKNRIFYFFAESRSWEWKGTDNYCSVSGEKRGMRKVSIDKSLKGKPYYYTLR